MPRFFIYFFILFFVFGLFGSVFSQEVPSGGLVPCKGVDCNFCHFLELARRILKFALEFIVVAAIIFILIGAIILATHGGSEQRFTLGKDILTSVIIGIVIAFAAWIIINSFFGMLTSGEKFVNLANPWYDLKCEYTAPPPPSKYICDLVTKVCKPDPNGPYSLFSDCYTACSGPTKQCGANNEGICMGVISGTGCPSGTTPVDDSISKKCDLTKEVCCKVGTAYCSNAAQPGGKICTENCNKICDNLSQYDDLINKYSAQFGVGPAVIKAIICRESDGNPNAKGDGGKSCGLMQVETATACESDSRGNLLDPKINIREGTKILAAKYASVQKYSYTGITTAQMAFAAYNCCAGGEDPNAPSKDCTAANGWGTIPKWACPINPGTGAFNMCNVKDYACQVDACASQYQPPPPSEKCVKISGSGPTKIVVVADEGVYSTSKVKNNLDKNTFDSRANMIKNLNFDPLTPSVYVMYKSETIGEDECEKNGIYADYKVHLVNFVDKDACARTIMYGRDIDMYNGSFENSCSGAPAVDLAHELGHTIGALYDEYSSEKLKGNAQYFYNLYGDRNCVKAENQQEASEDFQKIGVNVNDPFQGCLGYNSNEGPYWSDHISDLMRGYQGGHFFGPADKYFLNKALK